MKVLVVTTWLPTVERPEIGSFVVRDIEMLRAQHEVEVIHLSADGSAADVPFSTTTVTMSPRSPYSIARASSIIGERVASADLVHSMAASSLLPFRLLRLNRPWVHTEHWSALLAPSTAPLLARAAIPTTTRLLARPDVVIAVGNDLAAAISRRRRGAVLVIPNEVARPTELRERAAGETLRLVSVGGLIARKGPDIAIEAVASLRDRGIEARLVWVGDGPKRADLEELATRLGVADRIDFRGRVAPEDVADVIAHGDVFVLPTQMETFGVAIAEALVCGRPVVVGAQGEQASFVDEPDGVLVAERTGAAYADGIERVIRLNEGRSANQIAERTVSRFAPERRRRDYAAAYAQARSSNAESSAADVSVVIAVHDASRRIDRAIGSALTSSAVARVVVVCHNIDAAEIMDSAGISGKDPRVSYVSLHDGIQSPAGPFNEGLEQATGRFLSILGSDDELTVGAIDAWRQTAERTRADIVIPPLRHAGAQRVPTPPTLRRRALRGARDRLAYRTAPLGLISRERFGGLRFTPDLATGEDLAYSTRMWFSGSRIVRHHGAGEYLIHDGVSRVTFTARPIADELRAVELLIRSDHAKRMTEHDRTALAAKLWRLSVFGAVHYRADRWTEDDRASLATLVEDLAQFAPRACGVLSRADSDLIAALRDTTVSNERVDELSRRRRRFLSFAALMSSKFTMLLAREAPLRFSAATWWASRI